MTKQKIKEKLIYLVAVLIGVYILSEVLNYVFGRDCICFN